MKLDFTEFSYGYAFTENLIRWSAARPTSAPVFPNLVQEAQVGYDVRVDLPRLPLFFQFKLPELMVRETAREISKLRLSGLSVPFFRMPLMRRDLSDQHAQLIRLESQFPNSVFYASPSVDGAAAFNRAYCQAEVHLLSVLFSPRDIGPLPDDDAHSVSYSTTSGVAWRCSEPQEIKIQNFEAVAFLANELLAQRSDRSLEETVNETREGVLSLIPSELREAEAGLRQRIDARFRAAYGAEVSAAVSDDRVWATSAELLVLRELARVGLGVDLLIAQPRERREAKS